MIKISKYIIKFFIIILLISTESMGSTKINGMFFQIWGNTIGSFSQTKIDSVISDLKEDSINYVLIQYATYDQYAWYNTSLDYDIYSGDVIGRIVNSCEKYDVDYVFGLNYESNWETNLNDASKLKEMQNRSISIFKELYSIYKEKKNLSGFYIPFEIDDYQMLQNSNYKTFIDNYLKGLCDSISVSKKDIYIAPYFSHSDTSMFREEWDYILKNSKITKLIPQNGVGTHRESNDYDVPLYFKIYREMAKKYSVDLGGVAELFNQTHGYPVDDQSFDSEPMDIDTLMISLDTLGSYSNYIFGFDLDNYLANSQKLRNDYVNFYLTTSLKSQQIISKTSLSIYPNPFNPVTTINFNTNSINSFVKIYDIKGREIMSKKISRIGQNSMIFNGTKYSSGIYFVKAMSETNIITKKMILIK